MTHSHVLLQVIHGFELSRAHLAVDLLLWVEGYGFQRDLQLFARAHDRCFAVAAVVVSLQHDLELE